LLTLVLAEDGEGFVEASGGPEVFDSVVEDQANSGGLASGSAEQLLGGIGSEASVILMGSMGDGLGDRPAAGQATGLGGKFGPSTG
jgi:hypothetical protein